MRGPRARELGGTVLTLALSLGMGSRLVLGQPPRPPTAGGQPATATTTTTTTASDVDAPTADATRRADALARLAPVTADRLSRPADADWLQWGRTYDGHNFSPLRTITRDNVARLTLAWRTPLRAGSSMPTPVVRDGIVFLQTIPETVLALDGATGAVLWRHRHTTPGVPAGKRMGLALHGNRVFVPASDLRVLALDARTGEVVWNHAIALEAGQVRERMQLRSAPLIVGNKAIVGVTASMAPRGGFIVALDLDSGRELWRFYTIARPGEANGTSWNGLPLDGRSGGSVWHQGTYDAELNLIYFGVAPTYDTGPLLKRAGPDTSNDALYTNCTIALDPESGRLVWYYQHVANDQWDLDWVFERQIAEVVVDGRPRRVVMNVGKMAILDALDAATGQYLFSVDAGTQNVITSIDSKTGAKTIDLSKLPDPGRPTVFCPGVSGARAWPPTSFDGRRGLLYLPLTEWCNRLSADGFKLMTSGAGISPAEHPDSADGTMGRLQAIDVNRRALGWAHHQPAPFSTSLLATDGGVVFSGDLDPSLKAFDSATGRLLWQAPLDDIPSSSLVTYAVGGTQYVAVVAGLRNNHVNDLLRTYSAFRKRRGETPPTATAGGAAVWVFALQP